MDSDEESARESITEENVINLECDDQEPLDHSLFDEKSLTDFALREIFQNEEDDQAAPSDGGYSSPEIGFSPRNETRGMDFKSWENALETLGKDHPLLRPFQEAKRKQLQEQRDHLLLEIKQAEQQKADIEKERTGLGAQMYSLQEEITRAQVRLDHVKVERESIKIMKKTTSENLEKVKKSDDEITLEATEARKKERKLTDDLSKLDQTLSLTKIMRTRCDDDVKSLRISLQSILWDKKNFEKNKDIQEFHFERLESSLRRERNTLEILQHASQRATEEAEELNQAALDQQEELLAVERESKAVEKAWEQNVILMEKKSQKIAESLALLETLRNEESGIQKQLLCTRKEVKLSQIEHEKVSHRLLRLENHILDRREKLSISREELVKESELRNKLEETLEQLEIHLKSTNKELETEKDKLRGVYKRIEMVTNRSRQMEDVIIEKIHSQTTASKVSENMKQKIKQLKSECRRLEDEMVEEEQRTAKEALKVSNLKTEVYSIKYEKESSLQSLDIVQLEAEKQERKLKRVREQIKSNMNIIHRLKMELEKIIKINQGSESPPLEREERAVQIELKEKEKVRLKLQQEALHLQKDVLLAQKSIQKLNSEEIILQRENQILKDRSLRLETDTKLEKLAYERQKKSSTRLNSAIRDLDYQIHKEKTLQEEANHLANITENELTASVKDLEDVCAKEEHCLELIRFSLDSLEDGLTTKTRERNDWINKLEKAREAKEEYVKEKGSHGEMETMKKEINRMNVRWRALEATQRELSLKLARSVDAESALKDRAFAALEKINRDPNSIKATRQMQLDAIKRKINKNQKQLNDLQRQVEHLQQQKKVTQEKLQLKERQYSSNVKMLQESANILQEKLSKKRENQIHLQEERLRMRYYTALKENNYRCLAANNEEAQESVRCSLDKRSVSYKNVLTQLLAAYPHLHRPLSAAIRLLDFKSE